MLKTQIEVFLKILLKSHPPHRVRRLLTKVAFPWEDRNDVRSIRYTITSTWAAVALNEDEKAEADKYLAENNWILL